MRHVNIAVIAAVLVFSAFLAPARAQVLVNERFEHTELVSDESGCVAEDFLFQGTVHFIVQNMPQGGFASHLTVDGTLTGIISGAEAQIFDSLFYIQPQTDNGQNRIDHSVRTVLTLNAYEQGLQLKVNILYHQLTIDGEVILSLGNISLTCRT